MDRFHVIQDANPPAEEARKVETEVTRRPRWPLLKKRN
ncbi:MAG: hypothetical protein KM310_07920 [Clostridiales bacterium]|nr:hypothetical protein [Clostridiales bacterium]MBT9259666.1 hypothetical protein [Clostridiales bacterium]